MKNSSEISVVLVCTDCVNTRILYHGIKDSVPISGIITELPVSRMMLIKRRIKRLGLFTTAGQLVFQLGIVPLIRLLSQKRVRQIVEEKRLNTTAMPLDCITNVPSVNSEDFIRAIDNLKPDIILVNGTRIIASGILEKISCPVINVHVGITPLYRGVHGAYWALANKDQQHCGVTIHFIDKGIDTGSILAQDTIDPGREDNFITYPYLQFEKAIQLVKEVMPGVSHNSYSFKKAPEGKSKLWYHPTIFQYLSNRFRGVK